MTERARRVLFAAAIVGAALSLVVLTTAVRDAIAVERLLSDGVPAKGTVDSVEEHDVTETDEYGTHGTTTFVAVVRYVDESGVAHQISSDGTYSRVSTGDRIDVVYPRDDPGRGRAFVGSAWTAPLYGALLAAVIGALAFVCYAAGRVLRRRAP